MGPKQILQLCVSGPGSIGNEGILHIPQSSRASPSDGLVLYTGDSLEGGVGIFSSPCQLGWKNQYVKKLPMSKFGQRMIIL